MRSTKQATPGALLTPAAKRQTADGADIGGVKKGTKDRGRRRLDPERALKSGMKLINKGPAFWRRGLQLIRCAAEGGLADAQFALGSYLEFGVGCRKNRKEALAWYGRAAGGGDIAAIYTLGVCFHEGIGTKKNFRRAEHWFMRAVDLGDADAPQALALLLRQKTRRTKADLNRAFQLLKTAEGRGSRDALFSLGVCHSRGEGTEVDKAAALDYYRRAARVGDVDAQYNLGWFLENGIATPANHAAAIRWYKKAAAGGEATAKKRLRALRWH